jgi:MFS family permease
MPLSFRPARSRGLPALIAICLAAVILPLNFSAGAVATLAIGREFTGADAHLAWITNAFMLTFGSSLMVAGALADEFGRKRLFVGGVASLTLLSLALCVAPGVLAIDVIRGFQGLAAAAALAGGSASLAQVFQGRALMRAFSALGTSFGVGLAFGPLLAGVLIAHFGWRSIFLVIALVGALALGCGAACIRESRDPNASGVDWAGALSFTMALGGFTFAVVLAPRYGWSSALIVTLLVSFVVFAGVFVWVESRVRRPMLDLSLFCFPRFVGVQLLPIGTCYCYIVLLVMLPLRFIGIDGLSELDAGLLMLALSAPMLVMPFLAAWLARWIAPGVLSAFGLMVAAFGLWLMSRVCESGSGAAMIPAMFLIGCGTGFPWGLMDGLSISVVPTERAGMATGIFSTTRVAGEGVALAIVTAVLASLVQTGVGKTFAGQALSQHDLRDLGARLAAGDLTQAQRWMPSIQRALLVTEYDEAFRSLLLVLAAVTLVAAVVTFFCLVPRMTIRQRAARAG